jgi:BCD family chlorophyll transporter-like MFS transporter
MATKIKFTLSKLGIAWMFALVTVNFNRVTIVELGISAVLIGVMIGLYPFFGPIQPLFRRITDRYPIFGYRRSPWLVFGMVAGSLVFPILPTVAREMSNGLPFAYTAGFALFFVFGLMIALMANTYLDLIAECTTEKERAGVFAAAWTGQTAIIVVWALVFRLIMPTYSFERMQVLYTITPFVVTALAIASVWRLESKLPSSIGRGAGGEGEVLNSLKSSLALTRTNPTARRFFAFIVLVFMGIFTQDLIQEVWAGDVFKRDVGESYTFQMIFNALVTVGMGTTAALSPKILNVAGKADALPMPLKKRVASLGGTLAILSFGLLALASLSASTSLAHATFVLLGFGVGVFTFAAVTMMSDMTVEGQTQSYLGLWSIAQAIGLGSSFIFSGVLRWVLIETGWMNAAAGYATIFVIEGVFMTLCVLMLSGVTVERLRQSARGVEGQVAVAGVA